VLLFAVAPCHQSLGIFMCFMSYQQQQQQQQQRQQQGPSTAQLHA